MKVKYDIKQILLGIILIIYGCFKLFIGIVTTLMSSEFKQKILFQFPYLNKLIPEDETIASKAIEITFIIFGLYTLLHGLDKFSLLSTKTKNKLEARQTIYLLYGVIGTFLTIFYYLVVYTNINIEKDKKEINRYKLIGIVGGLSFLIMLPIMILIHKLSDSGFKYLLTDNISIISIISIIIITYFIYRILKETMFNKNDTVVQDLITLSMIPLNSF
jgi:hypothetical protein